MHNFAFYLLLNFLVTGTMQQQQQQQQQQQKQYSASSTMSVKVGDESFDLHFKPGDDYVALAIDFCAQHDLHLLDLPECEAWIAGSPSRLACMARIVATGMVELDPRLASLSHLERERAQAPSQPVVLPLLSIIEYNRSARGDMGFVKGVEEVLSASFRIDWVDIMEEFEGHDTGSSMREKAKQRLQDSAAILVKSNWGWIAERWSRRYIDPASAPPLLLHISGSELPPWYPGMRDYAGYGLGLSVDDGENGAASNFLANRYLGRGAVEFYSVIFYESPWYAQFTGLHREHRCAVRAFGVDTDTMRPRNPIAPRDIDALFVGKFADYKRPLDLLYAFADGIVAEVAVGSGAHLQEPLRVVAIGDFEPIAEYPEGPDIVNALEAAGVEVWGNVPYRALGEVYRRSKVVVVPCNITGGGERAVLEARASGASVLVADDNPLLRELALEMPIPSHLDYGRQLKVGLGCALAAREGGGGGGGGGGGVSGLSACVSACEIFLTDAELEQMV
jgi:glycosyltransferase involved in cell wall biosynthesis